MIDVKKLKEKDRESFELLYNIYADQVLGWIHTTIASPQVAIEILEETFVSAYTRIDKYHPAHNSLLIWLLKLTQQEIKIAIAKNPRLDIQVSKKGLRKLINELDENDASILELHLHTGFIPDYLAPSAKKLHKQKLLDALKKLKNLMPEQNPAQKKE